MLWPKINSAPCRSLINSFNRRVVQHIKMCNFKLSCHVTHTCRCSILYCKPWSQ